MKRGKNASKCDICKKSLSNEQGLKNITFLQFMRGRAHSDATLVTAIFLKKVNEQTCKSFIECDYCKATFAKELKFVKLMKEVHEESKPYKCETCEFRLSRQRNMAGKLSMNQFVHRYQNVNAVLLFAYLFRNLKINLLLLIPFKQVLIYCPV